MTNLKQVKIYAKVSIKYEGLYEQINQDCDTVCWIDPEVDNNLLLLLSQNVWSFLVHDLNERLLHQQDGREVLDWKFQAKIKTEKEWLFKYVKSMNNAEIIKVNNV